jgi:hypothetical protein
MQRVDSIFNVSGVFPGIEVDTVVGTPIRTMLLSPDTCDFRPKRLVRCWKELVLGPTLPLLPTSGYQGWKVLVATVLRANTLGVCTGRRCALSLELQSHEDAVYSGFGLSHVDIGTDLPSAFLNESSELEQVLVSK